MRISLLQRLRAVERVVASVLLVLIVALVAVSSATRYVGVPLIWSIELIQMLFVWLCVLAADLTLQRYGHFSVDMFASLLPRGPRKVLDVFNILLAGALLALFAYYGFLFAWITSGRPLPMLGITSGVATMALPVGFCLMLITLVEQLVARLQDRQPGATSEPREVM